MSLDMFNLQEKVAVVTGGYRGIGRAIAEGMAEAGANVVICARNLNACQEACAEIEKLGVRALAVKCDVTMGKDVAEMIQATIKKFGKLDILVNNAGITGAAKAILDMPEDEWQKTQDINLKGIYLCSKAAAQEMKKANQGKIINVTSVASFKPIPHSGDYCASKGGALLLTQVLALELIQYHIQVNAICPGYFATHLNPKLQEKVEKDAQRRIPIGRIGQPEEIKGLAVFLASAASNYLVGSAIVIDGGVNLKI